MSSGLAWILIGVALVAATGLGAALLLSRARLRLAPRALNALPVSVQIVRGSRVIFSNTACRNEFPDAVTPMAELLRRRAAGEPAEAELAYGDPVTQIVKWIERKGCDLVAMSTHGHRFLADIFLGTTASRVQHSVSVPVLLLRAK